MEPGGQKQRCAFARAMICGPKLVMADEPTGSPDSHSARTLLTIMAEQNRERSVTILMVTHNAFCASFSDSMNALPDMKALPLMIVSATSLIVLIMGWTVGFATNEFPSVCFTSF